MELAAEQAEAGEEVRLYACGGDGTFNEVLRGVRGRANAAVGCIPCGSGNDFVRNFGGREPFLDLERMMRGPAVNIDLIQTEKGIATTICSAGLDAQVAYGIPKFRRLPFCGGTMAYNLSIVQSICGPLGHHLRVQADDEVITGDFLMLAGPTAAATLPRPRPTCRTACWILFSFGKSAASPLRGSSAATKKGRISKTDRSRRPTRT